MSITTIQAVKEGIVLEGSKEPLGFPAPIANLFGKNLKAALGNDPVAVFENNEVSYGRQHPLAAMLGMNTDLIKADLRVYPVGEFEEEGETVVMDAYVSEDSEGNILLAYCPSEIREEWVSDVEVRGVMAMLAIEAADLDETLELLGQDFSGLESEED